MTVRVEKAGQVWTVIHDRPEARNAMDPASAEALTAAFLEFDADRGGGGGGVLWRGRRLLCRLGPQICKHVERRLSAR